MKNEKLFMILAYPIIILVAIVVIVILAMPIVLYSFPQVHKLFIVSNILITPHTELNFTKEGGVTGRVFYISAGSSTIAIWHLLPETQKTTTDFNAVLSNTDYKIVMYFHSDKTRKVNEFADFGRLLLKERNDMQLVAFDYKGVGNSAGMTTKSGAIEDAKTVFAWLRRHAPDNEIHFWGHGLGAGIAAATLVELVKEGEEVRSIVLEAPFFDTMAMLEPNFWPVKLYHNILPSKFFTSSLDIIDLNINTTKSISSVDVPTLVLNGESDLVAVPEDNSRKLVAGARRHRDFIFHIEWRCKKVKNWPGKLASAKEMTQIIDGFHNATATFWEP